MREFSNYEWWKGDIQEQRQRRQDSMISLFRRPRLDRHGTLHLLEKRMA